jgi:hypothetical protein
MEVDVQDDLDIDMEPKVLGYKSFEVRRNIVDGTHPEMVNFGLLGLTSSDSSDIPSERGKTWKNFMLEVFSARLKLFPTIMKLDRTAYDELMQKAGIWDFIVANQAMFEGHYDKAVIKWAATITCHEAPYALSCKLVLLIVPNRAGWILTNIPDAVWPLFTSRCSYIIEGHDDNMQGQAGFSQYMVSLGTVTDIYEYVYHEPSRIQRKINGWHPRNGFAVLGKWDDKKHKSLIPNRTNAERRAAREARRLFDLGMVPQALITVEEDAVVHHDDAPVLVETIGGINIPPTREMPATSEFFGLIIGEQDLTDRLSSILGKYRANYAGDKSVVFTSQECDIINQWVIHLEQKSSSEDGSQSPKRPGSADDSNLSTHEQIGQRINHEQFSYFNALEGLVAGRKRYDVGGGLSTLMGQPSVARESLLNRLSIVRSLLDEARTPGVSRDSDSDASWDNISSVMSSSDSSWDKVPVPTCSDGFARQVDYPAGMHGPGRS